MRMKQYVVIIFYQDIIVRKFCPCIFPSCHGLFLVLIPCQYHVWLSSYISSGKFRKIPEWAKNAIILSILFLARPRTQKKVNFGTLNTHTHTHTHTHTQTLIARPFPIRNFSMKPLFPVIWYFALRREVNQIDRRRDFWGWNFKKKMSAFFTLV